MLHTIQTQYSTEMAHLRDKERELQQHLTLMTMKTEHLEKEIREKEEELMVVQEKHVTIEERYSESQKQIF